MELSHITREEIGIVSDQDVKLHARVLSKRGSRDPSTKPPTLLIHGARVAGIPSFDLDVPNGSLAADLAELIGCKVFILDVRGYGGSTRPKEMDEPADANSPSVRSSEAVRDIGAAVDSIVESECCEGVTLLGWATGGQWASYYAALQPNRVGCLILDNSLYGATLDHPSLGHGSSLEDPEHRGQFNRKGMGAYSFNTEESLFGAWDRSIPIEDKSAWRDPQVADAYARAALASDPTSYSRSPPSFRAPLGALEDSFYLATGRQLWDASLIRSPTLILRSERDFWSRPEDPEMMRKHLVHSRKVRSVTLSNATHFVHLDRPERGRTAFIEEIVSFLSSV